MRRCPSQPPTHAVCTTTGRQTNLRYGDEERLRVAALARWGSGIGSALFPFKFPFRGPVEGPFQ